MKVRVAIEIDGRKIDEVVEGASPENIVATAKDRLAREMGFKGLVLRAMTPVAFAQEAVRKYNQAYGKNHPIPATADDFLEFGKETGYLTVLEA